MQKLVDTDVDLQPGDVVGEYLIEGSLGRGGFGVVYAGVHPLIGKKVAIKVLHRRFSADPDIVSRFVAEARAVNQIRHLHIIDIFAFGRLEDGRQYYVMERLAGGTLEQLLRERHRLGPREAMAVLRPLARALDAAHAAGIAHRDLKADNVLVAHDSEGQPFPKLLDFGVAKLLGPAVVTGHRTATGAPIGTPLYMSPEQARGRSVDHRTDIYSFGILCYQVLTGELPFGGDDYIEILNQQVSAQPIPPSQRVEGLPLAVDVAIAAMMAKDAADRPPSLTAAMVVLAVALGVTLTSDSGSIASSLTTIRGGAPVREVDPLAETRVTPNVGTIGPPPRRRHAMRWLVAASALACAGLAVWLLTRGGDDPAAAAPPTTGSASRSRERVVAVDAAVAALPAPADAAAAPATVETIELTVRGAPAGTEVTTAEGVVLGTGPGRVKVPRGSATIELHFVAAGYLPEQRKVLPAGDLAIDVPLRKRKKRGKDKPGLGSEIGTFD